MPSFDLSGLTDEQRPTGAWAASVIALINLFRMRQFCEAYAGNEKVSPLVRLFALAAEESDES